ncbi:MAG: dTMP kinase [Chloroflexi bacterium]|nr:dTMP kinase [Chloroflexota bacterium]MBV6436955.1 Thymidylate kinase [Anaerolineae bacterium]MDL1915770.1 dTMP kinase [Anaerolineae bacterium CFX4]MCC6564123.1 dTMP kinase [Chloroflexota bacterium]MCO6443317.1 dTMP kinase [Anaerolineae bacterium]
MFITFEGMDGSGKTTQIERVTAYLRGRGIDLLVTREPGGTPVGEDIRAILMDKANTGLVPRAEMLLFCASRAQLVSEIIVPHLERDGVVLCDRYIDSSLAYQGYGHGLNIKELRSVLNFATGGLLPDLTIYLDVTPDEGLRRRAAGSLFGEEFNRIDAMASEFHRRVYKGYATIGRSAGGRWARIDAAQHPDAVFDDIVGVLNDALPALSRRSGKLKQKA